jgi:hypothetical protein
MTKLCDSTVAYWLQFFSIKCERDITSVDLIVHFFYLLYAFQLQFL